ncbi:hypothetical protein IWW57_001060, partial [Coemansia sp. S610]
ESGIDNGLDTSKSITDKPDSILEESVGGSATSSVTNWAAIASTIIMDTRKTQLVLDRRSVIREGLLRQGFSESDIAVYFNQYSKGANYSYDAFWRQWAS